VVVFPSFCRVAAMKTRGVVSFMSEEKLQIPKSKIQTNSKSQALNSQ
jgi:hypothetical protein